MAVFETKFTSQHGFSLIESIVGLAVMAMVSLAIVSSNLQLTKSLKQSESRAKIDLFRKNLVNLAMGSDSWTKSINSPLNNGLNSCANYSGPSTTQVCTPSPYANNPWCSLIPQWCQPTCTTTTVPAVTNCPIGVAAARSLSLYDGAGKLYYNSADPKNGFTETGLACGPDADPPNNQYEFGSVQCPYRMNLTWYAVKNEVPPNRPVLVIRGTLQVRADHDNQINRPRYEIPILYRQAL